MGLLGSLVEAFDPNNLADQHPADEAARWAQTTTLTDVGGLVAEWLTGRLSVTAGYHEPVDVDEAIAPGITDALVALNLAGFVTYNSQGAYDGPDYAASPWGAWVYGYADDETFDRLTHVIAGTRFQIHAWPPAANCTLWRRPEPVGDRPCDGGWQRSSTRHLRWLYSVCGEQAIDAICNAWQVTIYDPALGSNDLWPHLRQHFN